MHRNNLTRTILTTATMLLGTVLPAYTASGATINVQFACTAGGSCNAGHHSSSLMSGAAVIGSAGDQWNRVSGAGGLGVTGSNVGLVDTAGAATGITVSWSGSSFYVPTNGQLGGFHTTPYANLMDSYLVGTPGPAASVTIRGLNAGSEYLLYMITQGDINSGGRTTTFTANGGSPFTTSATNGSANTFIAGQNYKRFDVFAENAGEIRVNFSTINEANVNGFQLVATAPEPGTVMLGMTGMALIVGLRRRLLNRK